ncbi:hsp70 family protein [Gigaspora margarita]|uniref:Hsp70 family protein n=1 Tax=Gigaspora margarita TaxID=4874 RepID=A0A8H4EIY1_GIGMA|nr:hsp70 family protein [Gigaspora margarita]
MGKEKEFTFEINGVRLIKWFRPDEKLDNVREQLAASAERNDWNSEKLFFKHNEIPISHKDETNYKLEKIQSRNVIFVENFMKKITAYIDGIVFTLSLDPGDKLSTIRSTLSNKFSETFPNSDFNFRWKDGKAVDRREEFSNNLEEILTDGNELYISILKESEITIYSSHSGVFKSFILTLDKRKFLTKIRKELESISKENYYYMCSDCCFLNQNKALIPKSEEDKFTLGQILLIDKGRDILNIHREHDNDDYDLIKRMRNKYGYGFITRNGSVNKAECRAFTFTENPKHYNHQILRGGYDEERLICKNEFHELCKRNFIIFGNVTTILPWVSVFFGINRNVSLDKLRKYETATEYKCTKMRRVSINVSKNRISVTKEFKGDVENALKENDQDIRVSKLKDIAERYGYFYADTIYFGGVIVEKIEQTNHLDESVNTKTHNLAAGINSKLANAGLDVTLESVQNTRMETDNTKSHLTIKGGDESKFKPDDYQDWINSLKDPETWDIIEYHGIHSIFSLLDSELQSRVLKSLGKRVLKTKVDEIHYSTENEQYVHQLAGDLEDIYNIRDCQIFTTIMKEKVDRHIFSSYVSYDGSFDKPIIIINRAPSNRRPRSKYITIRIGWIVVGYPRNTFDFDLSNQIVIESEKYESNQDFVINLQFRNRYVLTTCVFDQTETLQEDTSTSGMSLISDISQSNIRECKLVVGSFFSPSQSSACLFAYCSKTGKKQMTQQNNPFLQNLKLFICTINTRCQHFPESMVTWKRLGIMKFSRTLRSETAQININEETNQTNTRPIFVNNIIDDNFLDNYHGIINVASNHFQYRILNESSFKMSKSKLFCICFTPEND